MKIAKLVAREIFDSRGIPTVECGVILEDGSTIMASAPSGLSKSSFEAAEIRDGGHRLFGQGVLRAIETIENEISRVVVGKEPNTVELDTSMIELDGTEDKSRLGANALLPVSIAICRAQAYTYDMEPYELIAHLLQVEQVSLPFPMFNIVNGGLHAHNALPIQEFMVVPMGARHFRDAMEIGMNIFQTLKKILEQQGASIAVGDEGGFAPMRTDERFILDAILEAIQLCGYNQKGLVMLALDVSASRLYDSTTGCYRWKEKRISSDELIDYYAQLLKEYPLYSIEDGLSDVDWDGWKKMTDRLGAEIQLVGDDLFATNAQRIIRGLEDGVANAVLIKPNQIGTVTESLQALRLCQEQELNVAVSHSLGDTNDTFIVDLAVGGSVGQIKAGGCCRGECIEKYNRLLAIEDELTLSLMD